MPKPLFIWEIPWKDRVFIHEFYTADSIPDVSPIRQVQAVCFTDEDHVLLYQHVEGYYGLPGGGIEEGEDIETALRREVKEEAAAEIIRYGLFGYVKEYEKGVPDKIKYPLRFWAEVRLLDHPIQDPCGKAIGREVVSVEEIGKRLNWGPRGEQLITLAAEAFTKNKPYS